MSNYKEKLNSIHYGILKRWDLSVIQKELNLTNEQIQEYIENINYSNNQTLFLKNLENKVSIDYDKTTYKIHKFNTKKSDFKIMVVSDKHIDHRNDRIKYIDNVYDEAVKRGVDLVFDLGDILNGPKSLVHNPKKVRTGTLDGSLEQLKRLYPTEFKTHFITGNHDLKFMKHDLCDIGKIIEQECSSMKFLNNLFAPIEINGFRINLSHGSIENKELTLISDFNEDKHLIYNKPHSIFQGHFHKSDCLYNEGIALFQATALKGCSSKVNPANHSNHPGAIYLSIKEVSNIYEIQYEQLTFIESEKINKKEFHVKKLIN